MKRRYTLGTIATLIAVLLFSQIASTQAQSFWFPTERLITDNLGGFLLHLPTTTNTKNGSFDGWHNPDVNEVFRTMRWGTSETQIYTDTQGVTYTLESMIQTEMRYWEDETTALDLTWLDISNTSNAPTSTWNVEFVIDYPPDSINASAQVIHDAFNEIPLEDTAPWTHATVYISPHLASDPQEFVSWVIRHEIGHLHALNDLVANRTSIMSATAWEDGHWGLTNKDKQSLKYYFGKLGKYDFVEIYNNSLFPYVIISYNDWVPNGWSKECHLYEKVDGDWVWQSKTVESDNVGTFQAPDVLYTPYTPKVLTCEPNIGYFGGEYKVHVFEVIGVDETGTPVRVLADVTEFSR